MPGPIEQDLRDLQRQIDALYRRVEDLVSYRPHALVHELPGRDVVRLSVQNGGTQLNRQRTLNAGTGLAAAESAANQRIDLSVSYAAAAALSQIDIGDTATAGTASTAARGDHQHAFPAPVVGDVAQVDIGDAASAGVVTTAARADHQHGLPAPAAGYPADVAATEGDGTATTVARADHVHAHGSGYLPDAHHARSHDHSNALDNTALAPATVTTTGNVGIGGAANVSGYGGRVATIRSTSGTENVLEIAALSDAIADGDRYAQIDFLLGSAVARRGIILGAEAEGTAENSAHLQILTMNAGALAVRVRVAATGQLYPADPTGAGQIVAGLFAGNGAPANANGNNGDFYFRGDGTQAGNTVIYHKEAGAWVALTTT